MSGDRSQVQSGEQGFTLVELLAAMVGTALLLAALAAMTGTLGNRLRAPSAPPDRLAAQAALSTLAARVVPDETRDGSGSLPSRLNVRLLPLEATSSTQLMAASLVVVRQDDRAALHLRPDGMVDGQADQVITSGWRSIELHPLWRLPLTTDPGAPPLLAGIAVELTASDGSRHRLAAATRIDHGAACVFDPVAQSCRP